ncbi:MAG TPA: SIR2 family protein [Syntrophobacteraceae bacterium]|nr:SIR2 family protein [Syntrophobacteraceae bacterium]
MNRIPDLREIPDLPDEIIQAGLNGELVLFVGAGISMLVGYPSWNQLADKAFKKLCPNGLNYSELNQLEKLEAKKRLSIALNIADEKGINLDLPSLFKESDNAGTIYDAINGIGCVCVTTNYDGSLAPKFCDVSDNPLVPGLAKAQSTKPQVRRIWDKNEFFAKCLDEPGTVVHLHGFFSEPGTMILTTKHYLEHYDHPTVQHFLGELFLRKTVLFIGYRLEEAEILEHILRRGGVKSTGDRRRFVLQGFYKTHDALYKNLNQYYEKSFGVHLIGFVRDYKEYEQQEDILRAWSLKLRVNKPPLRNDLDYMDEVLNSG